MGKNSIRFIKGQLETMYPVNEVETGYWFWFWKLYDIVIDIFDYDNLPEGLSKEVIENNLILLGHCSIIKKNKKYFAPFSHIYDFDEYYQPTKMVYANPRVTDNKIYIIGKDCDVIYNTTMKHRVWNLKVDSGLFTFIARYARQLADIESTINIYMVNKRAEGYPTADGEATANSIKAFFEKIAMGFRAVISDDAIISKFRQVDVTSPKDKDGINDLLMARDKIIEQFLRSIGVRMNNYKKAQVNEEELTVNDQILIISLDNLLKARQEGFDAFNRRNNENVKVRINDKYKVERSEEDV